MRKLVSVGLLVLIVASTADGLPSVVTASSMDDDAQLTLRIYEHSYLGDVLNRCSVELTVTDTNVVFSNGDSFQLSVLEEENAADTLIISFSDDFTAQEIASGLAERSIDCGEVYPTDGDGGLEIYATALVLKDDCGFSCVDDNPVTAPISVLEVGDDDLENNDVQGKAAAITPGLVADRLAIDEDWFSFSLPASAQVMVQLNYAPAEGRINAELFLGVLSLATVMDDAGGGILDAGELAAGTYTLRVVNREAGNSVFYDLDLLVTAEQVFADGFEGPP